MNAPVRHLIAMTVGLGSLLTASAADFAKQFCDSTLRVDYIFSNRTDGRADVSMRSRKLIDGWHGRRDNLDRLLRAGKGNVTMTSLGGDTLYIGSFSSLFSEWMDITDGSPMAYEHTVLVPMPRDTVNLTLTLYDKHHNTLAASTHRVAPGDILIQRPTTQAPEYEYLHRGTYPGHRIVVAILAEGYRPEQMDTFMTDARIAADEILSYEPFNELRERFDFVAVKTPSADSGVSVPKDGQWRSTAFSSHFSTFYSDRYLTSENVFDIHDAIAGVPYDHLIILANTEEYGGGGILNSYTLTAAHHPKMRPVVVHEFGHSFGGLADEYFYVGDVMDDTYPTDVEPSEPNITTMVDFDSKWKSLLPAGVPVPTPVELKEQYPLGVYEGGGYSFKGIYRPAFTCRMRDNDTPAFCPACQAALKELILYYTEERK